MQRTERTTNILATLGVVAVLAMVLPAFAAAAQGSAVAPPGTTSATLTASGSATQQWAYGGSKWVNVSVQLGNVSYDSHAFFGWQVVFTATNTSNTTVELEAQRTMAASLFANYCSPSCTSPTTTGNLSIRGQETDTGFANVSTNAQVYENGTATSAVGLDNASSSGSATLNESYSLTIGSHSANGHLTVSGSSHGAVSFAPSLGIVPWNAAPNVTWNSSAAYVASGAWALSYQYGGTSLLGTTVSGSGNPSGNVTGTGTVDLVGADLGTVTLANGRTVPVIAIGITGPFDDVDGFLLVPHGFEIFAAGHHDWDAHSFGAEAVATSRLDIVLDATGHRFQVVASATSYAGSDTSVGQDSSVASIAPSATAAPNATAVIQGQPETVAQAQQASVCLTTACSATTSSAGSILPFLLVGLVAVVLVGTVGVVEYRAWSRRKSGGGRLVGGYSQQVPTSQGLPPPPQGPAPPMPPSGGA
jgi:hypothetical protein